MGLSSNGAALRRNLNGDMAEIRFVVPYILAQAKPTNFLTTWIGKAWWVVDGWAV